MGTFKLNVISYNCKHFVCEGPKFDYINSLSDNYSIIMLQEHWLFESELSKLSNVGDGFAFEAKSSMNENECRVGRPFGGCAILWNPMLQCDVKPVICNSSRVCGVLLCHNGSTYLIINVYMPCDRGYYDQVGLPEYIDVLNEVSSLIERYDTNYVIVGGDFNTDINRVTPQTRQLLDFKNDNDLDFCQNYCDDMVVYTFMSSGGNTSVIDHFLISKNLGKYVAKYSVLNNHLFSDHVPLFVSFNIDVQQFVCKENTVLNKVSWKKATVKDIVRYKSLLNNKLNSIIYDGSVFTCTDRFCTSHAKDISDVYKQVIDACLYAGDKCIPSMFSCKRKSIPGWNDNVEGFRQEALYWHRCWKDAGCPREGNVAEIMRITRARYHKAVKDVKRDKDNIRIEKMASAIADNRHRDLWAEVRKIKGNKSFLPGCVDNMSSQIDICEVFAKKYESTYNSVPYDPGEMQSLRDIIDDQICKNKIDMNYVMICDVTKGVDKLRTNKSDGGEGLYSDHVINGCQSLYVWLSLLFNAMLIHGMSPDSMVVGTMIPIPKNKRQSLSNSNNYRSIALSSIFGKILDWIFLIKEGDALVSSDLQFGFKENSCTSHCTFLLNETISYYNMKHTNVYTVMLDASKAFDRVHYCKLFKLLIERKMSPLVLRLLLNMYTTQTMQVRWGSETSSMFNVVNGVKQGGVLSPVLFAVYMDNLLLKLENSGFGCRMGNQYVGGLAYADDLTLLCPTADGMQKLLNICDDYAKEFDIIFNGDKSQLLLFKGRDCKTTYGKLCINDVELQYTDNTVHLGHNISTVDKDVFVRKAICNFWKNFNIFLSDLGHLSIGIKCKLFQQYCCSFYGSVLWLLSSNAVNDLCIAWRKALRILWKVPALTHCNIIEQLSGFMPLYIQLTKRFCKFIHKCMSSMNDKVRIVCKVALENPMSVTSSNYSIMNVTSNRAVVPTHIMNLLKEVISIRDGFHSCDALSQDDVQELIYDLCVM